MKKGTTGKRGLTAVWLTAGLLAVTVFIQPLYGQEKWNTLKEKVSFSGASVNATTVLEALQRQTGYAFTFDAPTLNAIPLTDIHWVSKPLGSILQYLQDHAGLSFLLSNRNIAVSINPALKKRQENTKPAQGASLRGRVVDFETAQPLPGATVQLQGTSLGAAADGKGYYVLRNVPAASYMVIVSYVGYERSIQSPINIENGKEKILDVKMQAGNALSAVQVTARRRVTAVTHTTDKELLQEIRNATGVVSGISNEMIAKTGDRNAAEVVKRISGVTVVDDRFIVVRGMNERYNLTFLNDNVAPSTELYSKAFAYDLLPSSIIDRVLVHKSPVADLVADYAGAAVKVYTKDAEPVRHLDIGFQTGLRQGSSLTDINSYNGGKWDWLGMDDGARKLPAGTDQASLVKGFSPELDYGARRSAPDIQGFINYYDNWRIGRSRLYNLTSLTYTNETRYFDVYRQTGNTDQHLVAKNASGGNYYIGELNRVMNSQQTTETGKMNVLENLTLKWNDGNSIKLKNFFVNEGRKLTSISNSRHNVLPSIDSAVYTSRRTRNILLSFQQRLLYAANLTGDHQLGKQKQHQLVWNLGYTYDLQSVPDQRGSNFLSTGNGGYFNIPAEPAGQYIAAGSNSGAYDDGFLGMISRLFVKLKENVYNAAVDYTFRVNPALSLKAGTYQLFKTREVSRRFFRVNRGGLGPGEVMQPGNEGIGDGWEEGYGHNDPNIIFFRQSALRTIWDPVNFPEDGSGLAIYDVTDPSDSYTASEENHSFYLMGDWKTGAGKLTLNGGVRVEYDKQQVAGAIKDGLSGGIYAIWASHPLTSVLPSFNISYRPDARYVIRVGYGRTLNRPEFRELTPYNDFDFQNNEMIRGNPNVVSATIDNFDLRAELYPQSDRQNEMLNAGIFYKRLKDPIERLRWERSGYTDVSNFTQISFGNAIEATVYGVEAEIRKNLSFIPGHLFRNLSVVINGALIRSHTRQKDNNFLSAPGDSLSTINGRPLQGQSPYVLNGGLFYENIGWGTKIGLMYNVSGPRIYAKSLANPDSRKQQGDSLVFQSSRPDLLQLPVHLLDFSITQRIIRSLQVKLNIQNILDQSYRIVEDQNYNQQYDREVPVRTDQGLIYYTGDNIYNRYKPGRYFTLQFTYAF